MWINENGGRKGGKQGIDGPMDFVFLPKRMLGRLLDVKVFRGECGEIYLRTVPTPPHFFDLPPLHTSYLLCMLSWYALYFTL